ncbi:MAG: D-glycero-beta-D-manno-heptose-7-phosphate kinase [Gammaproteobacteria bacterium]|nr:D-glycero-beta-D-manno-heptose-7-phosphate kinase [Gammaproteobacteria bacterium]
MIEQLLPRLSLMTGARTLVIGDVMLDRYVYGSVERISPEAPVPVLTIEREIAMPGGAGNVARNLATLGAKTSFGSVLGSDAAAADLTRIFATESLITPHLVIDPTRHTTVKTRFVGASQQLLRVDHEQREALNEVTQRALLKLIEELTTEHDVMILSDYDKGLLKGGLAGGLISVARRAGIKVLVDPKGRDYSRYRGADILTPNRQELAEATGMATLDNNQVEAAARKLISEFDFGAVLATRGALGMALVQRDGPATHIPARVVEVFDVSGAGDTVIAVLAAAIAAGAPLLDAAVLANFAAGIVVAKLGTATCSLDELSGALRREFHIPYNEKVFRLVELQNKLESWRHAGLRIGFTNGCFDILHPGHISLIRQARSACDRLVVALNSDSSVRQIKGDGRPVNDERARALVLASLADVDAVILFEEQTPLTLIQQLLPDVLVKGADYTEDAVIGADVVKAHGGRVILADLMAGWSTTNTIARMQERT